MSVVTEPDKYWDTSRDMGQYQDPDRDAGSGLGAMSSYLRMDVSRGAVSIGWRDINGPVSAPGVRGSVSGFSSNSRKRALRYLSSCAARYRYIGTLTIGENTRDGEKFKKQVDRYLVWKMRAMRGAAAVRLAGTSAEQAIFWWLEFQARGAPHLHYLYTTPVPWQEAAAAWSRCIGDPELIKTGTKYEKLRKPESIASYVAKYATKWDQKIVPEEYRKCGRFWGVRGWRAVRVATLAATSPKSSETLGNALKTMFRAMESSGDVIVRAWPMGKGATIYPARGSGNLELSGVLREVEVVSQRCITGGVAIRYQRYEQHQDDIEIQRAKSAWIIKRNKRLEKKRQSPAAEIQAMLADETTQSATGR